MEIPQIGECANTTELSIYYKKLCISVVKYYDLTFHKIKI